MTHSAFDKLYDAVGLLVAPAVQCLRQPVSQQGRVGHIFCALFNHMRTLGLAGWEFLPRSALNLKKGFPWQFYTKNHLLEA